MELLRQLGLHDDRQAVPRDAVHDHSANADPHLPSIAESEGLLLQPYGSVSGTCLRQVSRTLLLSPGDGVATGAAKKANSTGSPRLKGWLLNIEVSIRDGDATCCSKDTIASTCLPGQLLAGLHAAKLPLGGGKDLCAGVCCSETKQGQAARCQPLGGLPARATASARTTSNERPAAQVVLKLTLSISPPGVRAPPPSQR